MEFLIGAVYTSPSGIFLNPKHGTTLISFIEKIKSVPGPMICTLSVLFIRFTSGSIALDNFG